ncbi:MAG: GNAT family N-acetyltransferase [Anaerolineales bacterium]|nr:GNAT family N-acetyltransferase [Anaerolineales bacterium]
MWIEPLTLTGQIIRLEPLSLAHTADLVAAAQSEEIWQYLPYGLVQTAVKMQGLIQSLLSKQQQGSDLPFAVIHVGDGKAVGMTRYMEMRPQHRGLEIGGTWYGPDYQRTAVNTEAKYLLLQHAFEVMNCLRVQLKTDQRNIRSQKAIERIGAVKEGTLRQHIVMPDGYIRDTIYYSILDKEWPHVKASLRQKLSLPA